MSLLIELSNKIVSFAAEKTFDEDPRFENTFPTDYQDTYDLGVHDGRVLLARELLGLIINS